MERSERKQKTNILQLVAVSIAILYTLMPVVSILISRTLTTYFYLAVMLLVYVLMITSYTNRLDKLFMLLGFYVLLVLLDLFKTMLFGSLSAVYFLYGALLQFLPCVIGLLLLDCSEKENKFYVYLILGACLTTIITSLITYELFPAAARYLATVPDSGEAEYIKYAWRNTAGYSELYQFVLLVPLAIYLCKAKKINVIIRIALAVLFFVFILATQYTIALILFVFSLLLNFQKKNLSSTKLIIWTAVIALFILILAKPIGSLLISASEVVESNAISSRLKYLGNLMQGVKDQSFDDNRVDLYMRSFNSFLDSPLIGKALVSASASIGGHSNFLDILGSYGLIGAIPLIGLYVSIFKIFVKPYKRNGIYGYLIFTYAMGLALSIINTGYWLFALCVYLPATAKGFSKNPGRQQINENIVDNQYANGRLAENIRK